MESEDSIADSALISVDTDSDGGFGGWLGGLGRSRFENSKVDFSYIQHEAQAAHEPKLSLRKDGLKLTKADKRNVKDQPVKGTIIYIIYTFIKSLSFIFASVLYNQYPELQPFQLLLLRSVVATVLIVLILNVRLIDAVWTSIPPNSSGALIFRTF